MADILTKLWISCSVGLDLADTYCIIGTYRNELRKRQMNVTCEMMDAMEMLKARLADALDDDYRLSPNTKAKGIT